MDPGVRGGVEIMADPKTVWVRIKDSTEHKKLLESEFRDAFEKQGFEIFFGDNPPANRSVHFAIGAGGDGTLLSTLRRLGPARHKVYFLGLHLSSGLGFLPPFALPTSQEQGVKSFLQDLARCLADANFKEEQRWGLEVEVAGETLWALNDFVISKGPLSRMILLRMHVDGELLLSRMRGDGLILSSATGSTAYSLSAGGPVVQPTLNAIIVTPICPHEVSQRPLVLDSNSKIQIDILEGNKSSLYLTCDGQSQKELPFGGKLQFRRAENSVRWIIPNLKVAVPSRYFEQLRKKLRYGGDAANSENSK